MIARNMSSMSPKTTIYLPKVIALCGAKRCGKDTLANYIANKFMYNKIAFADPLKEAVCALFDFSHDQVGYACHAGNSTDDNDTISDDAKDVIDKRWGITPRKALQFFGTEVLQYKIQELLPGIDRKFLANSLASKIRQSNRHFVVSDMRFVHEYEEMKKLGALIIRIDRPSIIENVYHDEAVHTSEIEYRMIPYDMHILNDGDISNLIRRFDDAFAKKYGV